MKAMNDRKMLHESKDVYKQKFENKTTMDKDKINNSSAFDKKLKITGTLFAIAACIITIIMANKTPKVDTSSDAANALTSGFSASLPLGAVILEKDKNTQSKDYTIAHSSNQKESKIWVWDYAAEDGDYVQIIVNGYPIGDAFFIRNKPKEFTIPSVGQVQIKGVRDGGGGITYAVQYELNGATYFNNAPINKFNTYTLLNNFD